MLFFSSQRFFSPFTNGKAHSSCTRIPLFERWSKDFRLFWLFLVLLPVGFSTETPLLPSAHAGATASNWVVVVNGQSLNSRSIANLYCSARNIPARNIIVLPNIPDNDQITADQFRQLILGPLLQEIQARGLANLIQGIAYSADFPTAIDIGPEINAIPNKSPYLTPTGSINGLTYLYRFVIANNPNYIGFESNLYATRPLLHLLRPFSATAEQAKQLAELVAQSKHAEAAALLDTLANALLKNCAYPMHYQAAQQWALAGDSKQAIQRIELAIQGGWQYREHLLKDPAFATLVNDKDFIRISKRSNELPSDYLPTRGFDARTFYTPNTLGSNDPNQGMSYMLSTVLAVTRDLGVTPIEAKKNLQTSIRADFSHPKGSFIFTKTEDVRTKTREPNFAMAISKLKARGMNARVVADSLPPRGENCSGVMIGTPNFSWNQGGCNLLPGAIADNLTSLGGAMTASDQTKLSEFLRYGAAISSGAVAEPYSIQNKFPHPMIHVHYVDGLTAAEAFYSSVLCPYQLLIVGDPLCQPYCKPPRFTIENQTDVVLDNKPITVQLKVDGSAAATEPEQLQWILDGILRSQTPFDPDVTIKLEQMDPGSHEIRFLTVSAKPIEQRFEQGFWLSVGNDKQQLKLDAPKAWKLSDDKPLSVTVAQSPESGEIKILHDFEEVGAIPVGMNAIVLSPSKLGYGPVRLFAEQKLTNGQTVRSLPIAIQIEP